MAQLRTGITGPEDTAEVSIASGESLSDALDLAGRTLTGVQIPSAIDGTKLTLAGSVDGVNYVPVTVAGSEYEVTIAASRYAQIAEAAARGLRFVKLRTGTVGSASVQSAGRTLLVKASQL